LHRKFLCRPEGSPAPPGYAYATHSFTKEIYGQRWPYISLVLRRAKNKTSSGLVDEEGFCGTGVLSWEFVAMGFVADAKENAWLVEQQSRQRATADTWADDGPCSTNEMPRQSIIAILALY